ncbi:unnamed protein product [Dracunculus medinensis]|uniref:Secreted protein n=1 Tax=Dracunculus medinensis TaxID=318479 RepID=A0A0N4UGA1_DRAME|nr:unnamed protein product [Dracunculus medinensis]
MDDGKRNGFHQRPAMALGRATWRRLIAVAGAASQTTNGESSLEGEESEITESELVKLNRFVENCIPVVTT